MSKREYWMTLEAEDLAGKLIEKHMRFYGSSFNPVYNMWARNLYAYYSTVLDQESWITALSFTGDQGELVKMSVPQSRALIRQLVTLITKIKLAFNAIAEVSDQDVTEEVRISNAICSAAVDTQKLDVLAETMVESGCVVGTRFMKSTWRSDLGAPRAVQDRGDGKKDVVYEGDLEITIPTVLDVMYDFTIPKWEDLDWVECRVKRSRWSLIAQHPELEEEILKLQGCNAEIRRYESTLFDEDDQVYVYELYHKPTPAIPRGRMLIYSDKKTIFYDDVNPYGCIPIERFMPEPIEGIGYGYAMLSNLLPAQEMYDHEMSAIATNHSALLVKNISVPRGANINVQQINGMNYMDYTPQNIPGGGEPKVLDLLSASPEAFKFMETLLGNMQQMSNINAAVRGELPAGTSGVAIATLTTNALEFLSSYSKSLAVTLEKVMMHSINAYLKFANVERLVSITGKNFQAFSKKFTGDMLRPIKSVKLQAINPLMQTMAGRIDIADKTTEKGLVKDLQGYISILDGAPLSKLYEIELSENDLIQSENDGIQEGVQPIAHPLDNHPLHIMRHKTMLNDPHIRADSPRVKIIQDHIMDHYRLSQETDPGLMAMAITGTVPQQQPGGEAQPSPQQVPQEQLPTGLENQQTMEDLEETDQGLSLPDAEPAQPAEDLLGRA